ncbi:alpha-amylase-like [Hetaerina americana]|uniref:alpha-amylase-like n=1 Tax=Hetaerina americana TaxID=62018 RepID=UPI003A7F3E7D
MVSIPCSPSRVVLVLAAVMLAADARASAPSPYKDPHMLQDRSVLVHLFEWKFRDVALECERFLGPYGFGGVQVSPVHESLVVSRPFRPWWERYQVVSYTIAGRSEDEADFGDMVRRCNAVGVRIYVDVVLNHMTGDAPDPVRGNAGTPADPKGRSYPGVPYNASHFRPQCSIRDYHDASEVRNCELVGLHDLDMGQEYVRGKQVEFLNALISHGVAGFRVDAAKHMWPEDLRSIFSRLDDLKESHGFARNSKPLIFQEVIDLGGEGISWSQYSGLGRVTDFKYGAELGGAFSGSNLLKWLKTFGTSWGLVPSEDAVVFVDNHDNQRGHGGGGSTILTYKNARLYKMAVAFMLAWPHGLPRLMSSFHFERADDGPPHNPSTGNILDVVVNEDLTCAGGWVCEHRWRQIYNMVAFRNAVEGTGVDNWWDNGSNQMAFCRGRKGFIAFNGQHGAHLKRELTTCLPPGVYCDVISGSLEGGRCTGKTVTVSAEGGRARVDLAADEEDGVLAIHVQSRL